MGYRETARAAMAAMAVTVVVVVVSFKFYHVSILSRKNQILWLEHEHVDKSTLKLRNLVPLIPGIL